MSLLKRIEQGQGGASSTGGQPPNREGDGSRLSSLQSRRVNAPITSPQAGSYFDLKTRVQNKLLEILGLALAGYNGGISVISKPQSQWADETQRYLYWGSGIYSDAVNGAAESPRLNEWLSRASGMCKRAKDKLNLP